MLAYVRAGQSVLVMGGATPLAQACIRVASAAGCVVLTTAGSEKERAEVLALNPQVPDERVLRHDGNTLKYYLHRATGSRRLDVALVPFCDQTLRMICNKTVMARNGRVVTMSTKNALARDVGEPTRTRFPQRAPAHLSKIPDVAPTHSSRPEHVH